MEQEGLATPSCPHTPGVQASTAQGEPRGGDGKGPGKGAAAGTPSPVPDPLTSPGPSALHAAPAGLA